MRKLLLLFVVSLIAFSCKDKGSFEMSPTITQFSVIAEDTTVMTGSSVEFWAKTVTEGVGDQVFTWSVDDKVIANTEKTVITFDKPGVYEVTFSAHNNMGFALQSIDVIVKNIIGGFYILNEGSFGNTMGSINHFDEKTKTLTVDVYGKANKDLTFGNTSCYATVFEDDIYVVSKQGNRLVKADAYSWQHKSTLTNLSGNDGRAYAGIDEKRGIITTSRGAFVVSSDPLAVGNILDKTDNKQCGSVYVNDNHIFVIIASVGVNAYSKSDYKLVKEFGKGSVGFTVDKDGNIWAAEKSELIKIDPKTLTMSTVTLPTDVVIYDSWGSWNTGSLCASPTENAIFFAKGGQWGGGNEIYKYIIGDENSLKNVFIKSTQADDSFYGQGISVDPLTGDIIALFVNSDWSFSNDNRLSIYDSKTGAEKLRHKYEGYYFPTMVLFNN